jgi:hypothetical protein
MITPVGAIEAAKKGLHELGLQTNARMASALDGVHVGVPLFVKRLDEPNRGYYLVPWISKAGVTLIIEVDAMTGTMSSFFPLPQAMPSLAMNAEQAIAAVSDKLGRQATGEPQLVWRPCRESSSPVRPFYQIKTAEGDVYVNMDGKVYTRLASFEKGG